MQLIQLPLEIQNAIFETLVLNHESAMFIRARLASTYFARSIRDAFLRTDACFEVYLDQALGRLKQSHIYHVPNVWKELEVSYLISRYIAHRPILKNSYRQSPFPLLERLGAFIEDAIPWAASNDGTSRLQTTEMLIRCALGMQNGSLRSLLRSPFTRHGFVSTRFEHLCAAALLGHLHVALELLSEGVQVFDEAAQVSTADGDLENQTPYTYSFSCTYTNNGDRAGLFGNPAQCAAASGHLEILKAILEPYSNSAKPALVPEWATVLILSTALRYGHNHIVDYMLGDEVHTSITDPYRTKHVLGSGVHAENRDGVVKLLKSMYPNFRPWNSPDLGSQPPWFAEMDTVLEFACKYGKKLFVAFAFEHGAGCPHAPWGWALNPASAAAIDGHVDILEMLLTKDSSTVLRDVMSLSPVWRNGHPLQAAISRRQLSVVKLLLDYGVSPDATFRRGCGKTPLGEAIEKGHAEMVDLLLSRGASMSLAGAMKPIKPADWKKPSVWHQAHLMAVAASAGHEEVIRVLGKYGVSPRYPYTKPTALQVQTHDPMWNALRAPQAKTKATVRVLVELGAADPGDMEHEEYMRKAIEVKLKEKKRKRDDIEASTKRRLEYGLRATRVCSRT